MTDKMADTLNSLGMLRQKQKRYKDAEAYFAQSLELRKTMKDKAESAQAQAQSLTSLGSLHMEMGDAAAAKGEEGAEAAKKSYDQVSLTACTSSPAVYP